ncbi:MAG TPA: ATP-binding cassette domain-containing protein, partial [Gemmatimonadaceae bacterium]
ISFVVPTGAHAVLTGPTASGKTTLLAVIAGAVAPTAGDVVIAGINVTSTPPELRGVGLVPQHGYLFPHLSVRQNIEYGAEHSSTALDVARRFGVDHLVDRSVASLSGGERQLVALCRALAPHPAVLLLDEPLSALDAKRCSAVLREFSTLQSEHGFTVLHVTHRETDAAFASARLEMANGAVVVAAISSSLT